MSKLGDPLEKPSFWCCFVMFRDLLESKLSIEPKGKGSCPPYDYVLMFKIGILQQFYGLSDDQVEYQINDRMSFMRFLNLVISDDIPDSKTIWNFLEKLKNLDLVKDLFELFTKELNRLDLIVNQGKIIDASFIEVPSQRNKRKDNNHIKKTRTAPKQWDKKPNKKRQKDINTRWTKKNFQNYSGYKNHAKVDGGSKLIDNYTVTDVSVHDSQTVVELLNEKDRIKNYMQIVHMLVKRKY